MPYYFAGRDVTANVSSTSVTITWDEWNQATDYGTGPIDHYRIYYWKDPSTRSSPNYKKSMHPSVIISDLLPETLYHFAIAAVKVVDVEFLEGPRSLNTSANTGCGGKQIYVRKVLKRIILKCNFYKTTSLHTIRLSTHNSASKYAFFSDS